MEQNEKDLHGLRDEDFSLLGRSYMNDFPLLFEETPEAFRIVPPRSLKRQLAVMSAGIFAIWVALVAAIFLIPKVGHPGNNPAGLDGVLILGMVLAGIVAVGGPILAHLWRVRHLRATSPLVEFDRTTSRVSVLAGAHRFDAEQVHCLLMVVNKHDTMGDSYSELQLVVDLPTGRERRFIMGSICGYCESFRDASVAFANATGIKLLNARREWLNGGWEMTAEEIS
jgi:hypothetical protein